MDPRSDRPGNDELERERREALRRVERGSRSPLSDKNLPNALRAISIALALLGILGWWFVTQSQKTQMDEPADSPPRAAAPAKSAATDAKTSPATSAAKPAIGSYGDRDRSRPLDRERPDGR
jgi:hypothetical protein